MKAVILPAGRTEELKPLTAWMPEYLLPVVNKPIVEHLIELLVRNEIKDIILVRKHMPYETEGYFSKGERWGVNISYSLEQDFNRILLSLSRLRLRLKEPFLCLPGNIVTNIDLSGFVRSHSDSKAGMSISGEPGEGEEFFPFILEPDVLSYLLEDDLNMDIKEVINSLEEKNIKVNKYDSSYDIMSVQSLTDYWEVNKRILKGDFAGIIIPGRQIKEGVWIDRHTKIHPDTKMEPPLLIGKRCNIRKGVTIGEATIIGDNVVVDQGASIEESIIFGNTYIGSHTEIRDSVVRKNYMVNIPRQVSTYVSDQFILGDTEQGLIKEKVERLFNLFAALILLAAFSPIMILLFLYHLLRPSRGFFSSERRFGSHEIVDMKGNVRPKSFTLYFFRSRNRFIRKLPGLFNVIKGDMNMVGVSPLTEDEVSSLREEWETLRFEAPVGLFHLWEVDADGEPSREERLVMDNYYAGTRSFKGDLRILLRGFSLLLKR
jgi:NDP-sugar pyrophosphorylase family protein